MNPYCMRHFHSKDPPEPAEEVSNGEVGVVEMAAGAEVESAYSEKEVGVSGVFRDLWKRSKNPGKLTGTKKLKWKNRIQAHWTAAW